MAELTQTHRAIVDFECRKYAGAKEAKMRDGFDTSSTRYQALNWMIDHREVHVHDPMTVRRLTAQGPASTSAALTQSEAAAGVAASTSSEH